MQGIAEAGSFFTVFLIFISAALTDNILLSRFLGMCSCIGVSSKVETGAGLGFAVTFVTAITSAINYIVYYLILVPLGLEYLRLITFIVMIAAVVQLVEMVIERFSLKLYYALGIYLPLITVSLIGAIRERINEKDLPPGLAGPGITLIIIGIMALAFVGFSGMIKAL